MCKLLIALQIALTLSIHSFNMNELLRPYKRFFEI